MIPIDSPSAPIKRTSFAVISSLSRFSLSFALIVQHLQAKKIPYKDIVSARLPIPSKLGFPDINPYHNRCMGESRELFFVLPKYYTTLFCVCQVFFQTFFSFLKKSFARDLRHEMSMENPHKKTAFFRVIFYCVCFFTKIFAEIRHIWWFTNRLFCCIISIADGQSPVRFPFFAHCNSVLTKCQSYDIPAQERSRCAIFLFLPPKTGGIFPSALDKWRIFLYNVEKAFKKESAKGKEQEYGYHSRDFGGRTWLSLWR